MEDTVSGADSQVYVPDGKHPVTLDPVITLPGFKVGEPTMRIVANTYPTNFGDLAEPKATASSGGRLLRSRLSRARGQMRAGLRRAAGPAAVDAWLPARHGLEQGRRLP